MIRIAILIGLTFFSLSTCAQQVMQPKIMVIPYTKEGEDIRTVLEKDANKRIVLTKIKEAFDERGVSTIDFVAKLKAIESGEIFNMENKGDIKSQIIDMSGADIYVEAEIVCQQNRVNGQTNPESFVKSSSHHTMQQQEVLSRTKSGKADISTQRTSPSWPCGPSRPAQTIFAGHAGKVYGDCRKRKVHHAANRLRGELSVYHGIRGRHRRVAASG